MTAVHWHQLSLRRQVLLAVIIPCAVLTLGLCSYFFYERYRDLDTHHRQIGQLAGAGLAANAAEPLASHDLAALERLAQGALSNPSIRAVRFIDERGRTLAQRGLVPSDDPGRARASHASAGSGSLIVSYPLPTDDAGNTGSQEGARVEIALDPTHNSHRSRRMGLTALMAALGALLAGSFFALRIGRVVGAPLAQLSRTLQRMEADEPGLRIPEQGAPELAAVARGINQLADTVTAQLDRQQREIADATRRLRRRNTELEETRVVLERAVQTKDDFLARMSHELRTPLTSIIGFNRLLGTTEDREQTLEYIRHIEHAATLLRALINDILDFSRLQSEVPQLERISFDLENCLEGAVGMHDHGAISKQLELVLLIDRDVPQIVLGDPLRLAQLVNNLVSNAIKFTDTGEVVVHLSLEGRDGGEARLHCQVRDSGIGIPHTEQAQLFEPFVQADTSINRRYGGTGLGLAICQSLVRHMGGSIELHSQPLVGTTVDFTFRVAVPAAGGGTPRGIPGTRAPVLAYDSHDWSRRALRSLLSRWTDHLSVCNIFDAFLRELAAPLPPRLAIISLSPQEAQREPLERWLREIRSRYQGPLLVISANPELPRLLDELAPAGPPAGFTSRPLRRERLLRKCEELLGATPDSSAIAAAPPPLRDLRLLVAEDNRLIQTLISRILMEAGATVDAVENGALAVEACTRQAYDLVLLDMQMPEMDGITASRKIRSLTPAPPIICITAAINPLERQRLGCCGVDTILLKPIDEVELVNVVAWKSGRNEDPVLRRDRPRLPLEFAREYRRELLKLLASGRRAQATGDAEAYQRHMHELMGLAGMLEAPSAYAMVRALKQEGLGLSAEEADHLFDEAQALLTQGLPEH